MVENLQSVVQRFYVSKRSETYWWRSFVTGCGHKGQLQACGEVQRCSLKLISIVEGSECQRCMSVNRQVYGAIKELAIMRAE